MTQEALKLALDALETELSIDWTNNDEFNTSAEKMYEAIAAIKKALAQLEQEPVAWSISPAVKGEDGRLYAYTNEKEWALSLVSKGHEIRPLVHGDTTPSQRTWVGLTDDEMENTFIQCGGKWNGDFWKIEDADFHPFLRTIEAKLKEKNNA